MKIELTVNRSFRKSSKMFIFIFHSHKNFLVLFWGPCEHAGGLCCSTVSTVLNWGLILNSSAVRWLKKCESSLGCAKPPCWFFYAFRKWNRQLVVWICNCCPVLCKPEGVWRSWLLATNVFKSSEPVNEELQKSNIVYFQLVSAYHVTL